MSGKRPGPSKAAGMLADHDISSTLRALLIYFDNPIIGVESDRG